MNAPTTLAAPDGQVDSARLRLRVLRGRSQGAEHRLPLGRTLKVGHSFENDIVLRGRGTAGTACELQVAADGRMSLRVVAGTVRLLGREVAAGERMQLAPYLPVSTGDLTFAVGRDDEVRWAEAADEASEVAAQPPEVAVPHTALAEKLSLRLQPANNRLSRLAERPALLAAAGAVLLTLASAATFGSSLLTEANATPAELESELRTQGFASLSVAQRPDGRTAIGGLVLDEAQLGHLRQWAATNAPDAAVEAETLASMADAASDLLLAQNIEATVRPTGEGALVISGPFLPRDRERDLVELLRRDLPLVRAVSFQRSGRPGEGDLAYFFDPAVNGAPSFVDGEPGYIMTEDGSRWFAGALLPSGHQLVSAGTGQVTVQREGVRDTLSMGVPSAIGAGQ